MSLLIGLNNKKLILVLVVTLLSLASYFAVDYVRFKSSSVLLVVPNGFSGKIVISEHNTDYELPYSKALENFNTYEYYVAANGTLPVKNINLFKKASSTSLSFANVTPIYKSANDCTNNKSAYHTPLKWDSPKQLSVEIVKCS